MKLMTTLTFLLGASFASGGAFAQDNAPLLAQSCAGCHGQAGEGAGSIATIAGYDRDAFITVWEEFRNNERPATIMNRIAPGYSAEDVAVLADYFASIE